MQDRNVFTQKAATLLEPVKPSERIAALDILRGFALFGVLLAYSLWSLGNLPEEEYTLADQILNWIFAVLVDTKFYTLFATLFGLGFSIQLTRARSRGINITPVYCRRLFALMIIGLAHALLLRNGDILVPYAVMGFFLLFLRNASNHMLAIAAIIAVLFPHLARIGWESTGIAYPQRPETGAMSYLASNFQWVRYWYSTAITQWPASLPMFLFGFYVGRQRLIENIEAHRKWLRRATITGLATWFFALAAVLLLNIVWTDIPRPPVHRVTLGLLWSAHAWGLAAFYASTLLLVLQKPVWQRLLAPLGAVGRMALTNYLLQAVILVPVCIVFDLFDKVTPGLGVVLALGVWVLQIPASVWWLRRFRFGPAEWLWRSMTYGRIQPMRVADESAVAASAQSQAA
jgi:uncharacterized protein